MALLGNYSTYLKSPIKFYAGASIAQARSNYYISGALKNSDTHFGYSNATPSGYSVPYAFKIPQRFNFISSFTQVSLNISPSANLASGRNLESTPSSSIISINAQLDQIVTLIANAILLMQSSNADMNAAVNMNGTGASTLTYNVNIEAIMSIMCNSSSSISSNAFLTALANMIAEAGGPTPLSPEGLSEAVWSSILTDYDKPGTLGYAIKTMNTELPKKLDKGMFIALK